MSRLEAALRRATTGNIEQPIDEPPLDPPVDVEGDPETVPDLALARNEIPPGRSRHTVIDPTDEVDAETNDARFRTLNVQHSEKLVVSSTLPASLREQYRRLGATLHHAQVESGLKVLMVSSALPEEGKSLHQEAKKGKFTPPLEKKDISHVIRRKLFGR